MIKPYHEKMKATIQQYFNMHDMLRAFLFLKPFLQKYWKAYLVLLLLMGLDLGLTIAFARFFGGMIEAAVKSNFGELEHLVLIGVFLILLSLTSDFFNIYFETIATNGVKKDLKNHLFNRVLRLSSSTISNRHSGEFISHFTNDIHSLDGMIGNNLIDLIRLPLIYIAIFIYLFHLNAFLSLMSLVIAPIAAVGGVFFGLLLRRNSRMMFELVERINTLLNETFHGFHVIRSFTLEKGLFKKYAHQNQELYQLELKNAKLQGWFSTGGQLISTATYFASLCLGAYFVFKGSMTVGILLTFINLVNHLVYPLTDLASQWAGFQRSVVAADRLLKVCESPVDSIDLPAYVSSQTDAKPIEFRNITFSYDENQRLFERFHLKVPAGKIVALVGPSGAGKSTIFNLLQGFYQPQAGKITINNVQTGDFTLSELRSSIAHVAQETFLFGGTVRQNLVMARPDVQEEEMIQAAIHANIHEFIMSLPDGYETEIGEKGMKLSGGQKQRIAIARAILKDAPILLLDEATSALDSETEYKVKQALDQLMSGRTTLVIAHRLSTIQNADLIIVMEKGEIVQTGNHDELIGREGLYRKLYKTSLEPEKTRVLSVVSN